MKTRRAPAQRASVDAAIRWVGAVRYPREMTDDAAREVAIFWAHESGVVGPARDAAIADFTRHARAARSALGAR